MSDQSDFRDKLSGMTDEEIWLRNNIVIGQEYELDLGGHCHRCAVWIGGEEMCQCGRTPIYPQVYYGFLNDEEPELVFATGAPPDWVMEEIFNKAEEW